MSMRAPLRPWRRVLLAPLLLLLAFGCASRLPAMADELPKEEPAPEVGLIRSVEPTRLTLLLPGGGTAKVFARTPRSEVVCAGETVDWSALAPGAAIRLWAIKGAFGPPSAVRVEILPEEEGATVRRGILGAPPGPSSCPPPAREPSHGS